MYPNYVGKAGQFASRKVIFWLTMALLSLACLFSCKKTPKHTYKDQEYSDEFKVIYDTMNDPKNQKHSMGYLDSAFNAINDPTLNDRFRFYGFHFVYARRAEHDSRKALLYADSMYSIALKGANEKSYVSNFAEASFARGDAYFDLPQYSDSYKSL